MAEQSVIEIRGFKGINIREPSNMIQDDELVECINFDIGRAGELVKRTGFNTQNPTTTIGLNSVRLLGQFHTATYHQLIAQAGTQVYYSNDGVTWTAIRTYDAEFGIQYIDKFYLVSSTGLLLEWDGAGSQLLDADTRYATATVGAWANKLNATVTRDSNAASEGTHSIKAVATAASQMQISTTEAANGYFLVNSGEVLTISGKARPNATTRTIELKIQYFTSAGAAVSTVTIQSTSCTNDVFTTVSGTDTVPATARYASLLWEVDSPAAGQIFNFDEHSIRNVVGKEIKNSPNGTFCYVFRDRLYVLNSKGSDGTANSKLFFSEINDFDRTGWPSENNLLVSPGDGDFLTCLAVIHDTLIVFKGETTWGLYVQGEPDNWVLRNMNPEIGCISKYTPREIEGYLFFVGSRGVYKTDGNIFEDISSNILPAFENRVVNLTNANIDCAAWWEDRYVVLFNPTPSTRRYFVYHLRSGGWTEWEFGSVKPAYFLEVNSTTPAKGLWAGDLELSGKVFLYGNDVKTDSGVSYECRAQTKHFDFSLPGKMKRAKWFSSEIEGIALVDFVNMTEQGEKNSSTVSSVSDRKSHKVRGAEYFRTWAVELSFTSALSFTFYGISLFMHAKEKIIRAGV